MALPNAATPKSGSFLVDLSSADDLWRKLADATPAPQAQPATLPRLSRNAGRPPAFPSGETSNGTFARVQRVRSKSEGFVVSEAPRIVGGVQVERMKQDPWKSSERRMWFAAGTLMALAAAVLTMFAFVSFGHPPSTVASLPASPIPGMPELTAPATAPPAAAPAAQVGNMFRPPLPARVRASEPHQTTVARKHVKHHKNKKLARN